MNFLTLATHITFKEGTLPKLDERANVFFQKMMKPVNEALDQPVIQRGLEAIVLKVGDQQVGKKLVETIAVPHIKTLIDEFDAEKPSIVDDINNG